MASAWRKGSGIQVFCVEHGLSHIRRRGDFFYHTTFLRELYLQLHQQIPRSYGLVIDLHTGVNESGRFAEIYCHATGLLDALGRVMQPDFGASRRRPQTVRLLKIVKDTAGSRGAWDGGYPVCRTFVPETVWAGRHYQYVGLEIYLPAGGEGKPEDWQFARKILTCIHNCYRNAKDDCHEEQN